MLKTKPLDHLMRVQYKLVMQDLYMRLPLIANMKMNQAVFVVGTLFGFIKMISKLRIQIDFKNQA